MGILGSKKGESACIIVFGAVSYERQPIDDGLSAEIPRREEKTRKGIK